MGRYGSDKPDTRFGLEFQDVSAAVAGCGFRWGPGVSAGRVGRGFGAGL